MSAPKTGKVSGKVGGVIEQALIVPGLPHIYLAAEKSPAWAELRAAYLKLKEEIDKSDADLILFYSTQWLSVIGYLFQADPAPEWELVDQNWYEYGSLPYQFKVDAEFAKIYADEVRKLGHNAAPVNYRGFPIDTGTIVAQKFLNPANRIPAAMVSCNMYAEKDETLELGRAAAHALKQAGKRAVVVLVSSLSNRFHIQDIDPKQDRISSEKDDEWNRKICELLGEGRLEDVSQVAREFAREANGDMAFKGIWWLSGLCGESNDFTGKVFGYGPVWGTGAAVVQLTPTRAIEPRKAMPPEEAPDVAGANETAPRSGDAQPASASSSRSDSQVINATSAAEPVGAYPHARREGDFIFLSGVGPREPGTKKIPGVELDGQGNIVSYDVAVQTHSVIRNVKAVLEAAGSSLDDIIDVQAYLTNMKQDFPTYNKIYAEYFAKIQATRTTIEVGSLPTPIAVEFKVVARVRNG